MTWTMTFAVLLAPMTLNLLFAALCVAASRGFCPKWTMPLSALLYVGLALCEAPFFHP